MRRWVFTILLGVSLLLGVAAVVMWVRSYQRSDTWWWKRESWAFNTKAEAQRASAANGAPVRLVAWQQRGIGIIRSSGGGLMMAWGRYLLRPEDSELGWVEEWPHRSGTYLTSLSEGGGTSSWRGVTYPVWPDAPAFFGMTEGNAAYVLQETKTGRPSERRDLRRVIQSQPLWAKPSPQSGFGHVRWYYEQAEPQTTPACRWSMEGRGIVMPYWFVCAVLLAGPAGRALWVLRSRRGPDKRRARRRERRRRMTMGAIAAVSLALWVTAGVMWIRSIWCRDTLLYSADVTIFWDEVMPPQAKSTPYLFLGRPTKPMAYKYNKSWYFETTRGGVAWLWYDRKSDCWKTGAIIDEALPGVMRRFVWFKDAPSAGPGVPTQYGPAVRLLGFEYCSSRALDPQTTAMITKGGVVVAWWFLMVGLAVAPGLSVWWLVRRRQGAMVGLCECCGYDLRATPDRCPECGVAVPEGHVVKVAPVVTNNATV